MLPSAQIIGAAATVMANMYILSCRHQHERGASKVEPPDNDHDDGRETHLRASIRSFDALDDCRDFLRNETRVTLFASVARTDMGTSHLNHVKLRNTRRRRSASAFTGSPVRTSQAQTWV